MRYWLILSFSFLLSGCVVNPLFKPAQSISRTIIPEYKVYVQNDPLLTAKEKHRRIITSQAFQNLIKEYEAENK
jgi:hypothetical protein